MGRQILVGNPPIVVELRENSRARRLSLRVSQLDGRASLTVPRYATRRQIDNFLQDREDWLRGHVEDVAPAQTVRIGARVPVAGTDRVIKAAPVKRALLQDHDILVPQNNQRTGALVRAMLRLTARDALAQASDRYAAQLGRRYSKLSLRDTRSRWGSCSSKGVLMYSWRLIMAPPEVLDYVAAHEVAHLAEMNHSAAFWSVVETLCPEFEAHRAWLRTNGASLHRLSFED